MKAIEASIRLIVSNPNALVLHTCLLNAIVAQYLKATGRVCMEDRDMVKEIEEDMRKYIKILLEVGVPSIILRCSKHMESKDLGRPVAFLAKMIAQRPLAAQLVSKSLLDLNRWRRLFDKSSPREVTMDALMTVLDLARMDKGNKTEELPEQILCCLRLNGIDYVNYQQLEMTHGPC